LIEDQKNQLVQLETIRPVGFELDRKALLHRKPWVYWSGMLQEPRPTPKGLPRHRTKTFDQGSFPTASLSLWADVVVISTEFHGILHVGAAINESRAMALSRMRRAIWRFCSETRA
jgi:hypothetical protein